MADDSSIQRISRLTPLGAILALIELRVGASRREKPGVATARGCTLAEDVVATELPPQPIALRDGFAGQGGRGRRRRAISPIAFAAMPRRVDVGEPLPGGTDAVLPLDAVTLRGDRAEAVAAVAPGRACLPPAAMPHRKRHCAAPANICATSTSRSSGPRALAEVTIRVPRIRIVCVGDAERR